MAKRNKSHKPTTVTAPTKVSSTQLGSTTTPPALPKLVSIPKPKVDHLPMLDPAEFPNDVLHRTLFKALTMRRDHESCTEAEFVAWLANRLPVTMIDPAGNVHVDLRTSEQHRTMFTSHTDTVHNGGGTNKVRVETHGEGAKQRVTLRADGAALGADDGAGIALMCTMIDVGVPGYYVFFRGEERGGQGSSWLADHMRHLLAEFDRAVAFDRAGYSDVITHQGRGRCCSDAFADALSESLNNEGLLYMPCDGGVYTDTAEFIDVIPECTNLSVGYKSQHGEHEHQDLTYLVDMAYALCRIEWDELPTVRDPKVRESKYPSLFGTGHWSDTRWSDDDFEYLHEHAGGIDAGPDRMMPPEGSNEDRLMDALCNALDGDFADLVDQVCAHVLPDQPDVARRRMNWHFLTEQDLLDAMLMLDQAHSVTEVSDHLYLACEVAI